MATVNVSLPADGDTIDAADYNTPITTIVSEINGNLDNANIDAAAAIAGSKLADASVTNAKLADGVTAPIGSVLDFAGTSAPTGWLLCYGQALDASTSTEYQDLFDTIGNTYGGSDNTDFVVPDLRGRVIAGQDDMGGTSADRLTGLSGGVDGDVLGAGGGAETHTLTNGEMPAHNHEVVAYTSAGNNTAFAAGNDSVGSKTPLTQSTGNGNAHNNVQPTFVLNKIIKY